MNQAAAVYEVDKYSASSRKTRASLEATWTEYVAKAKRLEPALAEVPSFPLTPQLVAAVAALMKLDGFRSWNNYVGWAKSRHMDLQHVWTASLDHEVRQANKSVNRGVGTARQSANIDLSLIVRRGPTAPVSKRGEPVFPVDFIVISSLWIVREIEAAWTTFHDIAVDEELKTITWHLSASKTDARALSCKRSWGCLCEIGLKDLCPYHCVIGYIRKVMDFFNLDKDNIDLEFPFFADFEGKVIKKTGAVSSIETVMRHVGVAVTECTGKRLYGGHSMRVTGSRFWTGRGLEVFKVQIFARWGSSVILRYVADVPVSDLTGSLTSGASSSVQCPPQVRGLELLEDHIKSAVQQIEALRAEVERLGKQSSPQYVQNSASRAWHRVSIGGTLYPPALWKTFCGWPYAFASHTLQAEAPPTMCKTCVRRSGGQLPESTDCSSGSSD